MELGLFQLENLALTPARFYLIDLREEPSNIHPGVDRLLKQARRWTREEAIREIGSGAIPAQVPVVLLCQDGSVSAAVAKELEAAGHNQVYVVAGGVVGLLSEL